MNLYPRRPIFTRRAESSVYRMFFWVILILGCVWLIRQMQQGDIKSPFEATATPTRTSESFVMEGEAQFTAGDLNAAISAFREAVRVNPGDAQAWAKLARVQAYSSALLTTDAERLARLKEALNSAKQATLLAPDDSLAHAVLAFALDWIANPSLVGDKQAQDYLTQAEQEAVRALQLDNTNTLALAFYAEILVDQQKWTQGEQYVKQALDRDSSLMDVHRVYASVLESLGQYNLAIQEYDRAIALAPNLTFLYLRAGANYRRLGFASPNQETQRRLYERSLEYFAKAAQVNAQLKIKDPVPYLSISKTYSQMGEFFIAARNVQKALEFQPDNPDIYGQLGIIYFKSRNYEGSIPALKCAVRGCTPEESCDGRGGCGRNDTPARVAGLPLSLNTVDYYQVYFSVLAALGPLNPSYCPESLNVIDQVKTSGLVKVRPDIAYNITVAEQICSASASGGSTPLSVAGTATAPGGGTRSPGSLPVGVTPVYTP